MGLSADQRREFVSIITVAAGAFIGLALLPTSLTGPLGRGIGRVFWNTLGAGAWVVPVFLLTVGVARLRRLTEIDVGRAAVLGAGLSVLVPYWIAIVVGLRQLEQLPPSHDAWPVTLQLIGLVPAALTLGVVGVVGTAGAVLLGVVALTALTLFTVGWHPFRRLGRDPRPASPPSGGPPPAEGSGPEKVDGPEPLLGRARRQAKKPRRRAGPDAAEAPEEQAFITGEAAEPFPLEYLDDPRRRHAAEDEAELDRLGQVLIETLRTFRVEAELGPHRSTGPVVTQYEVAPAPGVKVGRIAALADDLALKMAAQSIRIVAPIPGRSYVGVEIPNPTPRIVTLKEILASPTWDPDRAGLPLALGRDLEGRPVVADLTKMPHLLIAGATGSGKSVAINTIITCLVHRYTERELRMLMIDPKMVELTAYNALPHLIHPVVTNNKDAAKALKWAMYEMEDRYELFSVNNVRNLHEFNRKVKEGKPVVAPARGDPPADAEADTLAPGVQEHGPVVPYTGSTKPYVVVVVDELADLMMTVQGEVEKPLAILAQKARATGIHLLLATQRPSVNVITGLIKANFPSRIAFRVASKVDSRTILDQNGAEALLGNGDMLFLPPGKSEPTRLQGAFISTEETERVTAWYRDQAAARAGRPVRGVGTSAAPVEAGEEAANILALVEQREAREEAASGEGPGGGEGGERDALFREAAETCIQQQLGSTSLLQRKLRIGYGRAARIIDQLHDAGILGPPDGSKAREVLIGAHQLDEYCD